MNPTDAAAPTVVPTNARENTPATAATARAPRKPRARIWLLALSVLAAVTAAAAALRLGPDAFTTPTLPLIDSLIKQNKFDRAASLAERLSHSEAPDPRVWYALARARTGKGDLPGAIEALRKVAEWSPRKPDALFFEGKALLELKRGREAEAAFRAAAASDTSGTGLGVNARLELLALYAMEERTDDFLDLFRQVLPQLESADRLEILTMRMRLDYEQTKPEINAEHLSAFVRADPSDAQARAGYAAALDKAGRLDDARREYLRAVADAPDSPQIRERAIDLLYRQGDHEEFARLLKERPQGSDARPEMAKFLAIQAQDLGDLERAATLLRQATLARPDVPEYHHRLAQALLRAGRKDEAAEVTAQRARLSEARDALRGAWNAFANAFEADAAHIDPALLEKLSAASAAAQRPNDAEAWSRQALRIRAETASPADASTPPAR